MKQSRRDILLALGGLGLGAFFNDVDVLAFASSTSGTGQKLLGGRFRIEGSFDPRGYHLSERFQARIAYRYDAGSNEVREIETKAAAHVIETHPFDMALSAVSSRRMDTLSIVDWNARREIATHKFDRNRFFYGHCSFSQNGNKLLATAVHLDDQIGRIYVFDFPSLKVLDVIVLNTGAPHDISAVGNDRFILGVGCTEKLPAQFVVFNLKTRQLSFHPTLFGPGSNMELIHLKMSGHHVHGALNLKSKGKLDIGGLAQFDLRDSGVSIPMPPGASPAKSEILSVEFDDETGFAWLTVPWQSLVVIWDVRNKRPIHSITTPAAVNSVSLLPAFDAMVVGGVFGFSVFDRKTFKPLPRLEAKLPSKIVRGYQVAHSRIV